MMRRNAHISKAQNHSSYCYRRESARTAKRTGTRQAGSCRRNSFGKALLRFSCGLMLTLVVMGGCFLSGSLFSSAQEPASPENQVQYKSIEIQKGDSLWSIAETYADSSYCASVADYAEELARINQISPESVDSLQAGDYLMVFYY
ncbi:hypothetical protein K280104A7_17960 [Candidatus Bariatricus faecipullorum]